MSVVFLPAVQAGAEAAAEIIEIERAALDRWGKGDPDGFLEICSPDVVYFDPFTEHRLNGREALKLLYDSIRGQISIDRYEMVDPRVRVCWDVALLTFNFVSHGNEGSVHWNVTEMFERKGEQWEIVHTHWSFAQPKLVKA